MSDKRNHHVICAAALWAGLVVAPAAFAQGVDPSLPGKPACPPLSEPGTVGAAPPESAAPGYPASDQAKPRANLSDQLARSDGVICPPPHVDPEIRKPAPNVGRMPVMPPPGSNDPAVRPK